MDNIENRVFIQKSLKRPFFGYISALILFLVILSSSVIFNNYATSLIVTLNKLYTLKINLVKIKDAIKDINNSLYEMRKIIPPGMFVEPSIKYIYSGLDKIKTIVGKAKITTLTIEDKGNELRLPIVVSGSITNYKALLDGIGDLQSMKFPFFTINSFVITETKGSKGESTFIYEIKGELNTPKTDSK